MSELQHQEPPQTFSGWNAENQHTIAGLQEKINIGSITPDDFYKFAAGMPAAKKYCEGINISSISRLSFLRRLWGDETTKEIQEMIKKFQGPKGAESIESAEVVEKILRLLYKKILCNTDPSNNPEFHEKCKTLDWILHELYGKDFFLGHEGHEGIEGHEEPEGLEGHEGLSPVQTNLRQKLVEWISGILPSKKKEKALSNDRTQLLRLLTEDAGFNHSGDINPEIITQAVREAYLKNFASSGAPTGSTYFKTLQEIKEALERRLNPEGKESEAA